MISMVMCGRNDEHEGDFVGRMNASIASISFPVEEIVFVEWKPPVGMARIADVLARTAERIRVVTVPGEGPMWEYVAKNVGIRRAIGDVVLVTNPDILFPGLLFGNRAYGGNGVACYVRAIRQDLKADGQFGERHDRLGHNGLLTSGAGDFLMMSKAAWFDIGGFPELDIPTHSDAYAMFNADLAGLTQVICPYDILHQWHPVNPNGKHDFDASKIGVRNGTEWGLAGYDLPEVRL